MMMKRAVSFALFGLGVAVLGGCPIYPSDGSNRVCIGSDCYACPDPYYSNHCYGYTCNTASDCPSDYVCSSNRCVYNGTTTPPRTCAKPSDCRAGENCGADNKCHAGDCSSTGCPSAYQCKLENGVAQCVPKGGGQTSTCKKDSDCTTPAGSKCLTGTCVAPADQCVDGTQCAGGSCVAGACTPSCSATKPCPTGYACDTAKSVCTGQTTTCSSSSQCSGGTVCVEERCVTPCGPGGTCEQGLVCLDGGCTPNEKPVFDCVTEGVKDNCQTGSICLRHACYISCDGAASNACATADVFNVCKSVTTSSGTYPVCGSSTNLGTECDAAAGNNCASPAICIDGFCR